MNELFRNLVCGALAAMFATPMAFAQTVATLAPPNAIATYPMGVHGNAIVGSYVDGIVGGTHAFSLSPQGTYTEFAAPEADPNAGTVAVAIDDAGIVSGYFYDVRGIKHAFVRFVNGQVVTIDVPGAPFPDFRDTAFVAVNGEGTGIGYYIDYQYIYGGFARTPGGAIILIDVPGSTQSFPKAINSKRGNSRPVR